MQNHMEKLKQGECSSFLPFPSRLYPSHIKCQVSSEQKHLLVLLWREEPTHFTSNPFPALQPLQGDLSSSDPQLQSLLSPCGAQTRYPWKARVFPKYFEMTKRYFSKFFLLSVQKNKAIFLPFLATVWEKCLQSSPFCFLFVYFFSQW